MMDKYQMVLGAVAVSIMVLVPILCVIGYDLLAGRWDESLRRWRDRRSEAAEHRRALRAMRSLQGAPLEQLAADLRRLRTVVRTDEHRSAAQQLGDRLAYDQVLAEAGGTVVGMDALSVGVASWRLGAGRAVKDDPVQAGAGIEIHSKPGDQEKAGQPLFTLLTDDEWRIPRALEALDGGVVISECAPAPRHIILDRVG